MFYFVWQCRCHGFRKRSTYWRDFFSYLSLGILCPRFGLNHSLLKFRELKDKIEKHTLEYRMFRQPNWVENCQQIWNNLLWYIWKIFLGYGIFQKPKALKYLVVLRKFNHKHVSIYRYVQNIKPKYFILSRLQV